MTGARRSSIAALMGVVALVGVVLGGSQTEGVRFALFIAFGSLPVVIPAVAVVKLVPQGRRGLAYTWVASTFPLVPVIWTNVGWLIAYVVLGRAPDARDPVPWWIVGGVPILLVSICLQVLSPIFVVFGTIVWELDSTTNHSPSRIKGLPIFAHSFAWLVAILLIRWDPVGAVRWHLD